MNADSISAYLADGFERKLFSAALQNLTDLDNKLRFNNFAYAMREVTRHVLHRRAPDDAVRACCWFKPVDDKNTITRRQRAQYAVQGGLSDEYVRDRLKLDSTEMYSMLGKQISNLSKHTHIEEETFDIPKEKADDYVEDMFSAMEDLFESIDLHREELAKRLYGSIDRRVLDEALNESMRALDELATHHQIDSLGLEDVRVTSIDHQRIWFQAGGNVDCTLQYGSASDRRGDNGAELEDSFPFTCMLWSPVGNPRAITIDEGALRVDTESFFR
ncbi:hypothetical protein [Paraburkholderia tropica]|uniref:pPIWI-associating nuclease domain-containing protein n=1 Tax=Paraburkholderia tropica TaxID=92647 RepID=UPI00159234B3|nr:hypothetical protein [Paraburkholderia tropica]